MLAALCCTRALEVCGNAPGVKLIELAAEKGELSKQLAIVIEAMASAERDVPDYLEVDAGKKIVKFVRTPGLGDVPYPVKMEPNLVVEYYAKN